MKKFTMILSAVLLICLSWAAVACGDKTSAYSDVYYASYGTWFTLPGDAVVKDGDGSDVPVVSGKIFIDRADDYTMTFAGRKETSRIAVVDSRRPIIETDAEVLYGTKGEPVALCSATASDGVREIAVTGTMYFGETEIDTANGFVPAETGEYVYVLTTVGTNGRTARKEIPVYIEETADAYADKITSFDKPYGIQQAGLTYGRAAYSEEIAFADETGSLQLQLNPKISGNSYEFILTDLHEPDITQFDAFYFYVYNDTAVNLDLYFHWAKNYSLKPSAWTRIELSRKEYESVLLASDYTSIRENFALTDINGLNINVTWSNNDVVLRDDCIYLSAIRGLHTMRAADVKREIDVVLEAGQVQTREKDNLLYHYGQLSPQGKTVVSNYADLQELIIVQEMRDQGVTPVADKILYFDDPAGVSQVQADFGVSTYAVTDTKTYAGAKTLEVISNGWDMALRITRPYIYDVSVYDAVAFAVYNGADYDLLLYNSDDEQQHVGTGGDYVLKAKSWTRVYIPVGDAVDMAGALVWIRTSDWSHPVGIPNGTSFYFSAMYGVRMEGIFAEWQPDDYADSGLVSSVANLYNALSESRKQTVAEAYNEFLDGYMEYLQESGGLTEGTVLAFDTEIGMKQISDMYGRAEIAYTTAVRYGNETGSTKLTSKANADLDISVTLPNMRGLTGDETLEMYVYYEGEHTYSLYVDPTAEWSTENGTPLVSGQWTKISIPLNGADTIQGYMLFVMDENWQFAVGETLYFSALKIAE